MISTLTAMLLAASVLFYFTRCVLVIFGSTGIGFHYGWLNVLEVQMGVAVQRTQAGQKPGNCANGWGTR